MEHVLQEPARHSDIARNIAWLRALAIPGAAACMLLAREFYGLDIPLGTLLGVIAGLLLLNWWGWRRMQRQPGLSDRELFIHLAIDVVGLWAVLSVTGGSANPFVFFFLLPLTIAATLLPAHYTWAMAALTAAAYTLLIFFRIEIAGLSTGMASDSAGPHFVGMWLGFVLIALLIAQFVASLGRTLRARDRALADAREQALRDERVIALGTLAAGAAHEMGTPLAIMAVVTGELRDTFPQDRHPELNEQLAVLSEQVQRCKTSLGQLSQSAGVDRAVASQRVALDAFVAEMVRQAQSLRSGSRVGLVNEGRGGAPRIVVDRTLEQAVLNILHNAIDASPADVKVTAGWDADEILVRVEDRGSGRSDELDPLQRLGASTKPDGLGLGLFLSHTVISRMGGTLRISDRDGGGIRTELRLPRVRVDAALAAAEDRQGD